MQNQTNLPLNEYERAQISDLADGWLRDGAFADAMALLDTSSQARAYWHGLHVAGDVQRGEVIANSASVAKDMAFLDTFRANLANELPLIAAAQENEVRVSEVRVAMPTANDSFFNWKWVGGLSAVAAAVVFSWNLVSTTPIAPNGSGAQLAQAAVQAAPIATVATPSAAGVMLRNPQLDALIAAHNQAGGSSALQMPSGFLRSATFNTGTSAMVASDK